MYPRYVDIVGNLVSIVGSSENESIEDSLTDLSEKLIGEIITNTSMADD